jgi:hypothetical protein
MDPIKEAFTKVKEDMAALQDQISLLFKEIESIKQSLFHQTDLLNFPTNQQIIPTHFLAPTDNLPLEASKAQNMSTSTGNDGVPTDRQADQQTDRHMLFPSEIHLETPKNLQLPKGSLNSSDSILNPSDRITHLEHVSQVLESLDSIKKDLRLRFKKLTAQEMLIFSTLYQLEEEHLPVDYSLLASKLHLSESSIRDYVHKITKKGIPLTKTKENNKKIILSLPLEFKKLASIQTILALREL